MKKIEQTESIVFTALSIQDAVTMVSLMDRLAEEFRELSKQVSEEPVDQELVEEYIRLGSQLRVLEGVGFCASYPGMVQYDTKYFPA